MLERMIRIPKKHNKPKQQKPDEGDFVVADIKPVGPDNVNLDDFSFVVIDPDTMLDNKDLDNPATVGNNEMTAFGIENQMLGNDNPYLINNANSMYDAVEKDKEGFCPIVFDGSNNILKAPSPSDLALAAASVRNFVYDMDKGYSDSAQAHIARGDLASYEHNIVYETCDMLARIYRDSITASCESYLDYNLRPLLQYTDPNGNLIYYDVSYAIPYIASRSDIYQMLKQMFLNWWSYMDDPDISAPQREALRTEELIRVRNNIATTLAEGMNAFCREAAFCEPIITTAHTNVMPSNVSIIDIEERDTYMKDIETNTGIPMTAQYLYQFLQNECMLMLDAMMPMVEILLYQSVNSMNEVFFHCQHRGDIPDMLFY